jgi:glutamate decarboxylase
MPLDLSSLTMQRIVVRNGLWTDLADRFLETMITAIKYLDQLESPLPHEVRTTESLHH